MSHCHVFHRNSSIAALSSRLTRTLWLFLRPAESEQQWSGARLPSCHEGGLGAVLGKAKVTWYALPA